MRTRVLLAVSSVLLGLAVASVPSTAGAPVHSRTVDVDLAAPARLIAREVQEGTSTAVLGAVYVATVADARRRAAEAERMRVALEHAAAVQAAERARTAVWDRIAQCETGGDWSMQGSRYSGGVGFANSTWNAFGGREFAPNAGLATREQQIVVAERVRDYGGYTGWGCAYTIGLISR
jgi:hypothetical protein